MEEEQPSQGLNEQQNCKPSFATTSEDCAITGFPRLLTREPQTNHEGVTYPEGSVVADYTREGAVVEEAGQWIQEEYPPTLDQCNANVGFGSFQPKALLLVELSTGAGCTAPTLTKDETKTEDGACTTNSYRRNSIENGGASSTNATPLVGLNDVEYQKWMQSLGAVPVAAQIFEQEVIDSVQKCMEAECNQTTEKGDYLQEESKVSGSRFQQVAEGGQSQAPSDQPTTTGRASPSDIECSSVPGTANSPSSPGHPCSDTFKRQKILWSERIESDCSRESCPKLQKVSDGAGSYAQSKEVHTGDTCNVTILKGSHAGSQEPSSDEEWSSEDSESDCNVNTTHLPETGCSRHSRRPSKQPPHARDDCLDSSISDYRSGNTDGVPLGGTARVRTSSADCEDDTSEWVYTRRLDEWMKQQKEEKQNGDVTWLDGEVADLGSGLSVPLCVWQQLYPYQQEGVRWLCGLHMQEVGGLLGDEMGMGKTVQMAVFLASLHFSKVLQSRRRELYGNSNICSTSSNIFHGSSASGGVLLACPATVLQQWVSELHLWCPPIRVCVFHNKGVKELRAGAAAAASSCGVLVTTYETLRAKLDVLLRYEWKMLILDEGQKIRNPHARITLAVKRFPTPHRYLLSASPIQNNLTELWAVCDFCAPGRLGTLPVFQEQIAEPIRLGGYMHACRARVETAHSCARLLQQLVGPFLLRRRKIDHMHHMKLPLKREEVLLCNIRPEQYLVYSQFLDSLSDKGIMRRSKRNQALAALTTLRKICNHPDLLILHQPELHTSDFGNPLRSGKLSVLVALLGTWMREGHKALIFSQTTQMLDLIENAVAMLMKNRKAERMGVSYLRLDGGTPIHRRHNIIKQFQLNENVVALLLSTRVGGVGVNLTAANRVVIFDPDWNPMTDAQARERSWRLGQERDVFIYRLLAAGTVEVKIYQRQLFKYFLSQKVLDDARHSKKFKWRDLHELFEHPPPPPGYKQEDLDAAASYCEKMKAVFHQAAADAEIEELRALADAVGPPKRPRRRLGRISNDKLDDSTISSCDEQDECDHSHILDSLFEQKAIQETIDHDRIEAPLPDQQIISRNCQAIAKRVHICGELSAAAAALKILRTSQEERMSHSIDVPTWTGRRGEAGMPRTARRRVLQQHDHQGSKATGSAAVLAGLRQLKAVLARGHGILADDRASNELTAVKKNRPGEFGSELRHDDLNMAKELLSYFLQRGSKGYSATTGELCMLKRSPDPAKEPSVWQLREEFRPIPRD